MSAARQGSVPPPHSITRNTVLSFAVQLTGAAFTAILVIFLTRRLGTHGYGVFALALGIASLVLLPSDFGTSTSVARFVAEHRDEPERIQRVMADGFRLKFTVAFVVSVLLAALAGPIASAYGIPAAVWPIRGMALALFGNSVLLMAVAFTAIGRIDLQLGVAFSESAVELIASIALVLAGAGATGAAFGRAIGYLAGARRPSCCWCGRSGPGSFRRGRASVPTRGASPVTPASSSSSTVRTRRSRRSTS